MYVPYGPGCSCSRSLLSLMCCCCWKPCQLRIIKCRHAIKSHPYSKSAGSRGKVTAMGLVSVQFVQIILLWSCYIPQGMRSTKRWQPCGEGPAGMCIGGKNAPRGVSFRPVFFTIARDACTPVWLRHSLHRPGCWARYCYPLIFCRLLFPSFPFPPSPQIAPGGVVAERVRDHRSNLA